MEYLIVYLAVGVLLALLERKSDHYKVNTLWDYFITTTCWLPMAIMALFEEEDDE